MLWPLVRPEGASYASSTLALRGTEGSRPNGKLSGWCTYKASQPRLKDISSSTRILGSTLPEHRQVVLDVVTKLVDHAAVHASKASSASNFAMLLKDLRFHAVETLKVLTQWRKHLAEQAYVVDAAAMASPALAAASNRCAASMAPPYEAAAPPWQRGG